MCTHLMLEHVSAGPVTVTAPHCSEGYVKRDGAASHAKGAATNTHVSPKTLHRALLFPLLPRGAMLSVASSLLWVELLHVGAVRNEWRMSGMQLRIVPICGM